MLNTAAFASPKNLPLNHTSLSPLSKSYIAALPGLSVEQSPVVVGLDHQTTRSDPKSLQQTYEMERGDDKPVGEAQGHSEMIMIDVMSSSNNTQTIMLLPFVSLDFNP